MLNDQRLTPQLKPPALGPARSSGSQLIDGGLQLVAIGWPHLRGQHIVIDLVKNASVAHCTRGER